jgi:hypothetical protein
MIPNGQMQTLTFPLRDFSRRWNSTHVDGPMFDLEHFKDFTFIELTHGVPYEFYRITLVGNCGANQSDNMNGGSDGMLSRPIAPVVDSTPAPAQLKPTQTATAKPITANAFTNGLSMIATTIAFMFALF